MKLSFCVEMLWPDLPCEQAMALAHAKGARAIEFWGWWDKDLRAIEQASQALNLQVAALCTPFHSLVDRAEHAAWLQGLKETIQVANRLRCPIIISQVGNALPNQPRDIQQQAMIEGLRQAIPLLEACEAVLVIEPLNTVTDHKGYYLTSSDQAAQVLQAVDHRQIRMLFDIYHQALMGEQVIDKIGQHLPLIGHMHCAGVPGRGPLSSGQLDYDAVFRAIQHHGYQGYVGVELKTDRPEDEVATWAGKIQ